MAYRWLTNTFAKHTASPLNSRRNFHLTTASISDKFRNFAADSNLLLRDDYSKGLDNFSEVWQIITSIFLTDRRLCHVKPNKRISLIEKMAPVSRIETPLWFVLNHIGIPFQDMAKKAVDRFNATQNCDLRLFAPTYVVKEVRNGEVRMKTVNLTFHYVFVRGSLSEVKALCCQSNGFSFLIDHSNPEQRYATVSDRDMANFKTIARAYKNCLPYFSLDEIDLEEGDLVEVINGDFPGLIGTYMPKARSNSGNIVLNVYNNVGTIAFNVKATDVRVLEFSRKSTRANDQIDAFAPHLLKALRHYHSDEALPKALAARLAVFCSRMGAVKLNNRKLDARLQALLAGGNAVIGNLEEATVARDKFERLSDAVTNEWTAAMIDLIFSVIDNDNPRLKRAKANVAELTPTSKAQRAIVDEYAYYSA